MRCFSRMCACIFVCSGEVQFVCSQLVAQCLQIRICNRCVVVTDNDVNMCDLDDDDDDNDCMRKRERAETNQVERRDDTTHSVQMLTLSCFVLLLCWLKVR